MSDLNCSVPLERASQIIETLGLDIRRNLITSELHASNDFYGNATILKEYCGIPSNKPLNYFAIEHGISRHPLDGAWINDLNSNSKIILTHSSVRAAILSAMTGKRAYSIGPILYYAIKGDLTSNTLPNKKNRVLLIPSHSTHHINVTYSITAFIENVKRQYQDYKELVVLLYWKDVLNGVWDKYVQNGVRFLCAGHIYDPAFLVRFAQILRSCDAVVTNNIVGSHIYHAATLNKPIHYVPSDSSYTMLKGNNAQNYEIWPILKEMQERNAAVFCDRRDELGLDQKKALRIGADPDDWLKPENLRNILESGSHVRIVRGSESRKVPKELEQQSGLVFPLDLLEFYLRDGNIEDAKTLLSSIAWAKDDIFFRNQIERLEKMIKIKTSAFSSEQTEGGSGSVHHIGQDFYGKVILNPLTLVNIAKSQESWMEILAFHGSLATDTYVHYLDQWYKECFNRFGSHWHYLDIVNVLYAASKTVKPRNYLEIGVRRGRSVCTVARGCSSVNIFAFDMWLQNYAGMENPGPNFVKSELAKHGHQGGLQFINGNSHQTLPAFFQMNPNLQFDMITVDGDHTENGALQDLEDVIPHLAIGGVLVFDDIAHHLHPYLLSVWKTAMNRHPELSSHEFTESGYGVAFAIRNR